MYRLRHVAYCGMLTFSESFDEQEEARQAAAEFLRKMRGKGFVCVALERDREKQEGQWEVLEPDDCALVPDECGVLRLSHITFECRECGSQLETKQESLDCCSQYLCYEEEEEAYA